MGLILVLAIFVAFACGQQIPIGVVREPSNNVEPLDGDNGLASTDLLLAFVVFRHGDRTPDQEELDLFPIDINHKNLFFPYGKKALTNTGKQRSFRMGEYLRQRYDGLISRLYLPDEIVVRTTDYARTKMTALAALAALYPPQPPQRWNPVLDWQPVPYDTLAFDEDDILYWYNCPRYLYLRDKTYGLPEIKKRLEPYQALFHLMSEETKTNITTPEQVFFLDNLFQTLENVGVQPPKWAQEIMPKIKDMTKIEYALEFYNSELIRLATGILMADIVNATTSAISGNWDQPKLRLYSAHENNVAALMAAARVFQPHQPNYGSTFSLELRRSRLTGQFGITAVYAPMAGGPAQILPIAGCGGQPFCDYDTFVYLVQDYLLSRAEYERQCPIVT